MKRRRRRYGSFFEDTIIGIIMSIVLKIALGFGLIFFLMLCSYKLTAIQNAIVLNSLASAVVLYYTFISRHRPPIREKIISCIVAISFWFTLIFGGRGGTVADTVILYLLITYIIRTYLLENRVFTVLNGEALVLLFFYITRTMRFIFINELSSLRFLIIPAILTVLTIPLFIKLTNAGLIRFKNDGTLVALLLTVLLVFCLSWSTIENLNYALDTSKPKAHTATIIEADYNTSGRGSIEYHFKLDIDGTTYNYYPSENEFMAYNEGDELELWLYKGAFMEPYYISNRQKRP